MLQPDFKGQLPRLGPPRGKGEAGWLLACVGVFLLVAGGHFTASDDAQKFGALQAILLHGTVSFQEGWTQCLAGPCSFYPLGCSLLMLPGAALGWLLAPWMPALPPDHVCRFFISLQNAVLTAALIAVFFSLTRRVGASLRAGMLATFGLAFGTMLWPYARSCWSEPGTALAVLGAVAALLRASDEHLQRRRTLLLAGGLLATAVSIRLEYVLLVPGIFMWLSWRHGEAPPRLRVALVLLAAPLVMAVGVAAAYNAVRYGAPWHFSNWHTVKDGFLPPGGRLAWALQNLWHYTLNPGDGPLWYSPALWLGLAGWPALWRMQRSLGWLLLLSLTPLLVFYVFAWGVSDWAWGLRFTYVFHPFLMLGACSLSWGPGWRKLVQGTVLVAGVAVQCIALPHNVGYLFERERSAYPGLEIKDIMADPAHAPIRLAWQDWGATWRGAGALLTSPPSSVMPTAADVRVRSQFVPDFWPVLALFTPFPRTLVLGAVLVLVLMSLLGWVWLSAVWREATDQPGDGGIGG